MLQLNYIQFYQLLLLLNDIVYITLDIILETESTQQPSVLSTTLAVGKNCFLFSKCTKILILVYILVSLTQKLSATI